MKLTGKLVGQVAAVELRNVLVRVILELFRQHWDLRLWDAWRSLVLCDVALRLRSQRQTLPRSTQDTLSAAAFVALLQQGYVTDRNSGRSPALHDEAPWKESRLENCWWW